MSNRRLVTSYISMGATLAGATWICAAVFPLRALAQVHIDPPQGWRIAQAIPRGAVLSDAPGITVNTGGTILHRGGVSYPLAALRGKEEGTVVLELSLDAQGNVTDARAVTGPEQLRRPALESALQWHYAPNSGRRIQATVDFRLPPVPETAKPPDDSTSEGVLQAVDLSRLPTALQDLLRPRLAPHEGRAVSRALMREIDEAVREIEPHVAIGWKVDGGTQTAQLTLSLRTADEALQHASESTFSPAPDGMMRIRVGGNVQAQKIENKVQPEYPPLARQARIQGTVRFTILINADGGVKEMQLVAGHPLLVQSAQDAVREWTWKPTWLNGKPVEVVTQVDVNYTLSQ